MPATELVETLGLLCANCHQVEHYEAGQDTVESPEGLPPPAA